MADYLYYTSAGSEEPVSGYSMEDLLSCTVCCEPYHEKHRQPVVLPRCGHSFCRPCIAFMVSKGCIVCPSCRTDQRVEGADSLPTEFSLLAISCAQQATKQESCLHHGVKLSFWCKTCNVSACGECLFEDHPMTSHIVIKSTAYIAEMKDSVTNITNKFMEALDGREKRFFEKIFLSTKMINDALRTITVLRKDMESARELMKGVKIVEGICNSQALSESAKFLGLKWNLQDVNLALGTLVHKKEEANDEDEEEEEEEEEKEDEESKEVGEVSIEAKEEAVKGEDSATEVLVNGVEESSENGTNEKEKADNENEKDIDEEENLTEEEKRKRRKIQKLKERLAAATAAAELAKLEAQEKIGKKDKVEGTKEKKDEEEKVESKAAEEKKDENENKDSKSSNTTGREAYAATSKNLKTWQRKAKPYQPVPREPSITPERETRRKSSITLEKQEADQKADEKEKDNKAAETKNSDNRKLKESVSKEDIRMESNTVSRKNSKSASRESINITEINSTTETSADVKNDIDPELKKSYLNGTKKPRGRMARNALKRAQTMDFSKRVENQDVDSEKETESENIKGLDLETHKINKVSEGPEVNNKETEVETASEKREEKEVPDEVPKEKKKERKKRVKKVEPQPMKEKDMFEMEPEEKERIATELMQVPSLTVCIEGAGGLLARIAWESMGLHIYCHQFQELPYDVIIKSNVLHALIPTKDPMVFLDIGTDDQTLGRVYITLWGHLRRASNFLLLCLGDRGHSFRLSRLFDIVNTDAPGERFQGGDYEYNNGRGGEALVDDLEYQGKYAMPMEMGMVTAASGIRSLDSQFYICTEEDLSRQFGCPFGRVTVGLPVLKEAVWLSVNSQIWIQDCGVVLDCPRI